MLVVGARPCTTAATPPAPASATERTGRRPDRATVSASASVPRTSTAEPGATCDATVRAAAWASRHTTRSQVMSSTSR